METTVPSLGFWCSIAAQHYYLRLQQRLAHLDIGQWFVVLVAIHESGGKLSQQELADALHLDKVAMTRALDHLDQGGYIERCTCQDDRRKHLVRATPKADAAVLEIQRTYQALNQEALPDLDETERQQCMEQLMAVADRLRPTKAKAGSTAKRVKA